MESEIDSLVKHVGAFIRRSALFGFVFELDDDESSIGRGKPLFGLLRDETTLRQYFKRAGEAALNMRASQRDGFASLTAGAGAVDKQFYAVIVTQHLPDHTLVVLVYDHRNAGGPSSHLEDIVASLDQWRRLYRLDHEPVQPDHFLKKVANTLSRNGDDLFLVQGYRPLLLNGETIRRIWSPKVSVELYDGLRSIFASQMPLVSEASFLKYAMTDFSSSGLEIVFFGTGHAAISIVTKRSLQRHTVRLAEDSSMTTHWLAAVRRTIVPETTGVLLAGGTQPLLWNGETQTVKTSEIVLRDDLNEQLDRIASDENRNVDEDGVIGFGVSINESKFDVRVFNYPYATSAILLRAQGG